MPRTPEFDQEQVLDAALRAFWQKGYEATSLTDLLEATGLARQSLYNTFGDKRALFLTSLRRYADLGFGQLSGALEGGSVRAAIRRIFEDALHCEDRDRGCFLVNATTELLPRDPEVGRLVASAMARQERALAEALRRGVRQGELHLTPRRIEQTARFLVGALQGLRVMVKATPDSPALKDVVSDALALRRVQLFGHDPRMVANVEVSRDGDRLRVTARSTVLPEDMVKLRAGGGAGYAASLRGGSQS